MTMTTGVNGCSSICTLDRALGEQDDGPRLGLIDSLLMNACCLVAAHNQEHNDLTISNCTTPTDVTMFKCPQQASMNITL